MITIPKGIKITPLCELGFKYGTDKCPQIKHSYTPYYYKILKDKQNSVRKVLELGIGYFDGMQKNKVVYDKELNRFYTKGASLYMWRDFFPKATVYGADIKKEALFWDTRIRTFQVDETKSEDLVKLIKTIGKDIDLVIDDASHKVDDQIKTALTILPLLKKGSTYIIEDVGHSKMISEALKDYKNKYVQDVPRTWHGGMLYVINV